MNEEQNYFLTDPPRFQKGRKTLFTFILTFTAIGVILWGLQLRNTVYAPYALSSVAPTTLKEQLVDTNIDFLKQIDTSGNGLSDYDKIYVYGTSRYLYDSFGYGMSDREVLQKGLPLCAGAGENCGGVFSAEGTAFVDASSSPQVLGQTNPDLDASAAAYANLSSPEAIFSLLNDPAQLRAMLKANGQLTDADLKKISDADLITTARAIFNSSTLPTSPSVTGTAARR